MECVCWSNGKIQYGEEHVYEQNFVTAYNLEEKTGFQRGKLRLTSHRLFWHDQIDLNCIIEVKLAQILNAELRNPSQITSQNTPQNRTNRQIYSRISLKLQRLVHSENQNYICEASRQVDSQTVQFEFEYGGHNEFYQQLNQELTRKHWLSGQHSTTAGQASASHNMGIVGIQRKMQDRLDLQGQQINDSFKDLNKLMNQAKEMVNLSNVLIGKISKNPKSSTGEETEDDEDMKKLKSYFLNMGIIDNPVTKETSGSKYYKALAIEIYNNLTKPILDNGGIMTLADVYCRLNRARAIAGLVSAEDLLNACKELNKLNYELKYNVYKDLNLHVLEIVGSGQHNKKKLEEICAHVKQNESLTPYALSNLIQSSLIVAKKLLLDAENLGMLCRDDTYMGLRFYMNMFLQR